MLPEFHETQYNPEDLADVKTIASYAGFHESSIRSFSTGRRLLKGRKMPDPVCQVGGKKLWLRVDIHEWLLASRASFAIGPG